MSQKPLLILDLDQCLIHASSFPMDRVPDFTYKQFSVYIRLGLEDFLLQHAYYFSLAIWSTGTAAYVRDLVQWISPPEIRYAFVFGRNKCTARHDDFFGGTYYVKHIDRLTKFGFSLANSFMLDDAPGRIVSELVTIVEAPPYFGEEGDNYLRQLKLY